MAQQEEWERPIGLTKECAICLDDSDDGECSSGDGRVGGDQSTVVSRKCVPSLRHESKSGIAGSSYFQKKSDVNENANNEAGCNMVDLSSDGDDQSTAQGENGFDTQDGDNDIKTADGDNSPKMATNIVVTKVDNPFASFAFTGGESSSSSSSWRSKKRPGENLSSNKPSIQKPTKKKSSVPLSTKKSKLGKQTAHPFFSKTTNNTLNVASEALQSRQLTQTEIAEAREKEKIERRQHIAKWHAFADPNAPIEQQRFQVLIAARIHARCQEKMVTKAMDRLRTYFNEKDACDRGVDSKKDVKSSSPGQQQRYMPQPHHTHQGLTVHSLASSNPETEIAPLLSSVLFGNVKAKQIVKAAEDVLRKFGGKVPESMSSLKEITGIGPKLAEILNIVNKRESY